MALTLKKVKGSLERVLDKNLQDLVRGIRTHKNNEAKFISECLEEIKQELRQENVSVKANAIAKLTYLQMLGYDISWAAFNIIEVMSCPKFTYKRIAYLAASQCFHKDLDVLMLSTNLLRKDLNSHNAYDAGLAITSLSCFITPDLARDLGNDVVTLMNSTKPYIRKKAVLLMYKVFLNHPDALRSAFPRLREKLEDSDPGVQSAAVHVICELARRNPQNYLPLAPTFFKLMTSSVNNWVLIKIIKLFGALTPIEPRLGKKLLEPLTNLIHSTSAMSLLYECIQTVIAVLLSITARPPPGTEDSSESPPPEHASAIQLCVQKLRVLIEDADQNLKYLGLLAMSKILEAHPKPVQAHKDLILACLDDRDESIRLRALDLLHGMVSRKNLVEITRKLIAHAEKAEGSHYRDEIVAKVIDICSQSNYQYVTNFEWYISVLVELARLQGMKRGQAIAAQILDVAIRVSAVRPYAVHQMAVILQNSQMFYSQAALQPSGPCEILYAAAWICGEFCVHLLHPAETLEALLLPRAAQLPPHIQAVYLQNAAKIYARLLRQSLEENGSAQSELEDGSVSETSDDFVRQLNDRVRRALASDFIQSADLEVQERASCFQALLDYVEAASENGSARQLSVISDLVSLFDGELNPVAPKAQRKVPVPDGLDLDKWINEPPPEAISPASSGDNEINAFGISSSPSHGDNSRVKKSEASSPTVQLSPEEMKERRDQRLAEQQANPHYLKTSAKPSGKGKPEKGKPDSSDLPRVVALQGMTRSLTVSSQPESSEESLLRSGGGGFGGGSMLEQVQNYDVSYSVQSSSAKKGKKLKKGVKSKRNNEEADDDLGDTSPRANVVVSTALDMPEGASVSDNEGKESQRGRKSKATSPDEDLHRRLAEIRLDSNSTPANSKPANLTPPGLKLAVDKGDSRPEESTPTAEKETSKKKKKNKEKEGAAAVKKKSSKHLSKKTLIEPTEKEDHQSAVETIPANEIKESLANAPTDDLDFWLAPTQDAQVKDSVKDTNTNSTKKSPSTSPRRSAKKSTSSKSSVKKHNAKDSSAAVGVRDELASVLGSPCPAPDRSEYEEADSGSTTPGVAESFSSDHISATSAIPSGFVALAENALVRLSYNARPDDSDNKHIIVSTCLQNLSATLHLKEFELSIMDSPGNALTLLRSKKHPDGVIRLPSTLSPAQQGMGSLTFVAGEVTLTTASLPRIRGTLSYIAKSADGSSAARQEQLEFRFSLASSAFIHPEPYSTADSLQQLMSSGLLTEREASSATAKVGTSLDALSSRVSSELHLTVVERPTGASSSPTAVALHGRTIFGDHLCLLLKQQQAQSVANGSASNGVQIAIDLRASNSAKAFLNVFISELVTVIAR